MAIELDEPQAARTPVVKRTALDQTFIGALVTKQQRDILKDGEVQRKDNGKARQELVLTFVTMPGTTAPAGIGDTTNVPEPGDLVRMILKGKAFGQWIELLGQQKAMVGDIVTHTTNTAQVYDANGKSEGPPLTTQAQIDAVPRQKAVGIYGALGWRRSTAAEAEWVNRAETAYYEITAPSIPAGLDDNEDLI